MTNTSDIYSRKQGAICLVINSNPLCFLINLPAERDLKKIPKAYGKPFTVICTMPTSLTQIDVKFTVQSEGARFLINAGVFLSEATKCIAFSPFGWHVKTS